MQGQGLAKLEARGNLTALPSPHSNTMAVKYIIAEYFNVEGDQGIQGSPHCGETQLDGGRTQFYPYFMVNGR